MESERAAKAIALHACTLAPIGLLLPVEKSDECGGVLVDPGISQGRPQLHDVIALLGIVEVERPGDNRRSLGPVKGIGDQHGIALCRESAAHLLKYRP